MKRVEAIIRPERLGEVASNLEANGLAGFTITDVRGHGASPELMGEYRGNVYEMLVSHKLLVTVFVEDDEVDASVAAISGGAFTGQIGDGFITVSELTSVYRIASADVAATAAAASAGEGGGPADGGGAGSGSGPGTAHP